MDPRSKKETALVAVSPKSGKRFAQAAAALASAFRKASKSALIVAASVVGMNKFRELGFIDYNGHLEVHSSLLGVLLADQPRTVNPPK